MKNASDLMTKNPIILKTNQRILECVDIFLKEGITSAPVVDLNHVIKGVLDEFSLVQVYARYSMNGQDDTIGMHLDILKKAERVLDVDPVHVIIARMKQVENHRVIVTSESKHVVGVISPADMMTFLREDRSKSLDLSESMKRQEQKIKEKLASKLADEIKSLKEAANEYENTLGDLPLFSHAVNEKGEIIFANENLHRILGYDSWQLIGRPMQALFAASAFKSVQASMKKVVETSQTDKQYTEMVTKDGQPVFVELISSHNLDKAGMSCGTISVSRPIEDAALIKTLRELSKKSAA